MLIVESGDALLMSAVCVACMVYGTMINLLTNCSFVMVYSFSFSTGTLVVIVYIGFGILFATWRKYVVKLGGAFRRKNDVR